MDLRNCFGMMASVSTLARSRGQTRPSICWKGFMAVPLLADVDEVAGDGRGDGHLGAHQMGASAGTLAALEVAVGGGGAALAGDEAVGVHGEAHGAARFPPLEAGGEEYLVQPLGFGLALDRPGA